MSKREIAALALRLLGIYCLVEALPYIQGLAWLVLGPLPSSERLGVLLQSLLGAGTLVASGMFLLLRADRVGRFVAGEEPEQPVTQAWSLRQVQSIAFSAVGAYLVATSMPNLCMLIVQVIAAHSATSAMAQAQAEVVMRQQWTRVIESLLRTGMGLWLFLGAKGWSNLWHRLHPAVGPGLEVTRDQDDTQ
jgi:hypothetical protein